jgi:16S rRNA (guanine966-N2)-methyltransferase
MRIIAGKHKGTLLQEFEISNKTDLRPTTDRSRESLFNILENSTILKKQGFSLRGAVVLDGFCGTGSIGLEALSRDAKFVTFIDNNLTHIKIAKANAEKIHELENCEFIHEDITKLSDFSVKSKLNLEQPYDLIFLDPPYKKGLIKMALDNLLAQNLITSKTIIVIEHASKESADIDISEKFTQLDKRKYGKTTFQILII